MKSRVTLDRGMQVPPGWEPYPAGVGCPDMASNLLTMLLLNEAPLRILHAIFEPAAVGMLLAMCSRYQGVPLSDWRAVTAAFVGVLFASVRVLNNDQPDVGEDQELEDDSAREAAPAGATELLVL